MRKKLPLSVFAFFIKRLYVKKTVKVPVVLWLVASVSNLSLTRQHLSVFFPVNQSTCFSNVRQSEQTPASLSPKVYIAVAVDWKKIDSRELMQWWNYQSSSRYYKALTLNQIVVSGRESNTIKVLSNCNHSHFST